MRKDKKTPASKTPAVKKPAVKKPAVKKPAVKKPAVKKPAVKKPKGNELELLVIHCTATQSHVEVTKEKIEQWHLGMLTRYSKSTGQKEFVYKGKVYPALHLVPTELVGGVKANASRGRGWRKAGYHKLFQLSGNTVEIVKHNNDDVIESWEVSNGARGYNGKAIHWVYAGGVDGNLKPLDTRNENQKISMEEEVKDFIKDHPKIKVVGHGELEGVSKACPSFRVADWLEDIGVKADNIYKC